jgi:hypothetical protein
LNAGDHHSLQTFSRKRTTEKTEENQTLENGEAELARFVLGAFLRVFVVSLSSLHSYFFV